MKFPVPICFNLTATRIGAQRKQTSYTYTVVDLEIPDVGGEAAPKAVEWSREFDGLEISDGKILKALGPVARDGLLHVRRFGEAFFTPVFDLLDYEPDYFGSPAPGKVVRADFLTSGRLLDDLSSFKETPIFQVVVPSDAIARRLRKNNGDGFAEFATVETHNLESRVAAARERLGKFLLVDGVFYEQCPEPKVVVFNTTVVDRQGSSGTATFAVPMNPNAAYDLQGSEAFEIEEHALALAKAKAANQRRSSKSPLDLKLLNEVNAGFTPDIDTPESIYGGDVRWMRAVMRAAAEIVVATGGTSASMLSDDEFRGYRLLVRALHITDTDSQLDLMSEAFPLLVGDDVGIRSRSASLARKALELIDSRAVSVPIRSQHAPRP